MTARPYELLARFKSDGTVAGCHVRTIETINGKDFESDPVPLKDATDPAFIAFSALFSASAVSENELLKIDKSKLTTDLATMTTERDSLTTQVATLTDSNAKLVENHKAELDAKQAELDAANATITTKNQEINGLDGEIQALESQVEQLTNDIATKQSQIEAYAGDINGLQTNLAELRTDLEAKETYNANQYATITKLEVDLADLHRTLARKYGEIETLESENTQAASRLSELQGDYDAMQRRLNALLNPTIPVGTPGQTKSVTFQFDETAWPGIVSALSDPSDTETPTETQATNAVFAFITAAYKANAAKIALAPVQERIQAAIEARAEAVLSSSSVVIE